MMKRILVAVDGSARAPAVVDAAVEMARTFGAELVAARAIFVPPDFPPTGHVAHPVPLAEHMRAEAEAALAALAARAPDVRWGAPVVRHGQPWRVVTDLAEELAVDLVVIGSHGYFGWDRVLGTTAAKVVNRARRNVLVVHEHRR